MAAPTAALRGLERIRRAVTGGWTLIYVQTWEEPRVERALASLAQRGFGSPVGFATWTCVDGIVSGSEAWPDTVDPLRALDAILASADPAFFLMKDLPSLLSARPDVVRRLRDCYHQLKGTGRYVVMCSPRLVVPEDLKKELYVVDYEPPDDAEILSYLAHGARRFFGEGGVTEADARRMTVALKGLTQDEMEHVLLRVFGGRRGFSEEAYTEILAEKEQASRKEGVLEFVPPRYSLEDIGGLENLKDWLIKRKNLFTREAVEKGLPVPKGLLMMGMSGCGKSLSVKAISALWSLPLFRLDMNLVFGTESPEYSFHRALKTVEAMSPALLWIDEIEMAITGGKEYGSGDASLGRIFSTFLTWMQEKDALVFVAATANRIHLLPAEIIRKGRFDQVFFIDLPNENERKQIFGVHLKRQGAQVDRFDVVFLAKATKGFNGAEIEASVQSAAIDAFSQGRTITEDDVTRTISSTVPLSRTMDEQIKTIKSWAHDRALSASRS